jgi:hypothetical protein
MNISGLWKKETMVRKATMINWVTMIGTSLGWRKASGAQNFDKNYLRQTIPEYFGILHTLQLYTDVNIVCETMVVDIVMVL